MKSSNISVYGAYWCPDCRRSKMFLGEHQIPYNWVDIESDPDAERFVIEKNKGKRIIILARGEKFTASQVIQEKVLNHPQIEVRWNTSVKSFEGAESKLNRLRTVDNQTGQEEEMPVDGAFIFIGLSPNTGFLEDSQVVLDRWGFIVTGHALQHREDALTQAASRPPALMETSVPGVFAAGDVRDGSTKQVVSAAGEGSGAALSIREYLKLV